MRKYGEENIVVGRGVDKVVAEGSLAFYSDEDFYQWGYYDFLRQEHVQTGIVQCASPFLL